MINPGAAAPAALSSEKLTPSRAATLSSDRKLLVADATPARVRSDAVIS